MRKLLIATSLVLASGIAQAQSNSVPFSWVSHINQTNAETVARCGASNTSFGLPSATRIQAYVCNAGCTTCTLQEYRIVSDYPSYYPTIIVGSDKPLEKSQLQPPAQHGKK